MANPTTVPGDLVVPGALRVTGAITPTKSRPDIIAQSELQPFIIPWDAWKIWNSAANAILPGTPATDDLGLVVGTLGSASHSIQTEDLKTANVTSYARCQIAMPWSYEDGQTVKLRFHAGMLTTISDGTATLDVQAYETDEAAGVGSDICATAATTINSVTLADIDFLITATSLVSGDLLDIRIAIAINDGATGTAVKGIIAAAKLLCDVR